MTILSRVSTQTIVLSITALIMLLYALETWQMRKEMGRQTELQLNPFVMPVVWHDANTQKPRIKLKNIGCGIALNIRIEPLSIGDKDRYWRHEFDKVTALEKGKEAEVLYDFYSGNQPSSDPTSEATGRLGSQAGSFPADSLMLATSHPNAYINPFPKLGGTKKLTIVFEDTEGAAYHLTVHLDPIEKSNRERQVRLGPLRKRANIGTGLFQIVICQLRHLYQIVQQSRFEWLIPMNRNR